MTTNRVIKTDGDLDITANDTSVSGTLTVSGQSTLSGLAYPTSDGSADQVLVTNGSGTLSFADAASGGGGGVDTVTSASEAASYSGTNRIIHITASEAVIFSSALSDRIIINQNDYEVKFRADVTNCIIQSDNDIEIENINDDGSTTVDIAYSKINCNNLKINASGDELLNDMSFHSCEVNCRGNLTFGQVSSSAYLFSRNNIYCGGNFVTESGADQNILDSVVSVSELAGRISLPSTSGDSVFTVRKGTTSASSNQVQVAGTTYLSGSYPYPFRVDKSGIQTSVIVASKNSQTQSLNSTENIDFDEENIDNTNAWSTDTFTAKVKGYYRVSSYFSLLNVTSRPSLGIYVNNSQLYVFSSSYSDYSGYYILHGNAVVSLDAGDTLNIKSISSDTTYSTVSTTSSGVSIFIEKIN